MVGVVGAPAEREFREVAGADQQAADLVGRVEQHLGALPGLDVFKHNIVARLVTELPQLLGDHLGD